MVIIIVGFKLETDHSVYHQKVFVDDNFTEVSEKSGSMIAEAVKKGSDFISVRINRTLYDKIPS